MKLNHINLVVTNVATAIQFFEHYFDFKCVETKGDNIVAVLKGSDDFTLVIMKSRDGEPQYPHAFHIGFMQDSQQEVIDIHTKLKNAGFDVGEGPKNIRDSFGFYFTFEAVMIEVGYYN
jgi:predicted enzyme related to lactoylglutathione lyase